MENDFSNFWTDQSEEVSVVFIMITKTPQWGIFRNGAWRRNGKLLFGMAIKKIIRHTNGVNYVGARWIRNDGMGMKWVTEWEQRFDHGKLYRATMIQRTSSRWERSHGCCGLTSTEGRSTVLLKPRQVFSRARPECLMQDWNKQGKVSISLHEATAWVPITLRRGKTEASVWSRRIFWRALSFVIAIVPCEREWENGRYFDWNGG